MPINAGGSALAPKPVPGRPCKLPARQRQRLWKILLAGAVAYGFPNEIWTPRRIAQVIRREFGVEYHPSHVWKLLLRAAGWRCQVPERRALQRDEEAMAHWKRYRWPHIIIGCALACVSSYPFPLKPAFLTLQAYYFLLFPAPSVD